MKFYMSALRPIDCAHLAVVYLAQAEASQDPAGVQ
jgi:hypothetical protein